MPNKTDLDVARHLKDAADQGRLIEMQWVVYSVGLLKLATPWSADDTVQEAYFAGAAQAISAIRAINTPEQWDLLQKEADTMLAAIELKHSKAAGTG